MTKKVLSSMLGSFAIAAMLLASPTVTAQINAVSFQQIDKEECDKCGGKDCKGCEGKEAKKTKKAKAGKSCTGKSEGKSCCAQGSKKQAEAKKATEEQKK